MPSIYCGDHRILEQSREVIRMSWALLKQSRDAIPARYVPRPAPGQAAQDDVSLRAGEPAGTDLER